MPNPVRTVTTAMAGAASHRVSPIACPRAVKSAPATMATPIACALNRYESPTSQRDVKRAPSATRTPKWASPRATSTNRGRNMATTVRTPLAGDNLAPRGTWKRIAIPFTTLVTPPGDGSALTPTILDDLVAAALQVSL
jgi:hypothetical protein